MKINNKIIILAMLVMMIACISAVSATDINGTDDVSDIMEVDEVTDVVEDVEIDDVSEDVVEEQSSVASTNEVTVNIDNYQDYFNSTTGYLTTSDDLKFVGTFENVSFDNFVINQNVGLTFNNVLFKNVGFKLLADNLTLSGANFYGDASSSNGASIYVNAANVEVSDNTFELIAPEGQDFYAINVLNANNTKLLENIIYYDVPTANAGNYNHVVRIVGSKNVKMNHNAIVSQLPIKAVDFSKPFPSIYTDLVAAVAVQSSNNFTLTNNDISANVSNIAGGYPTLDAVIIVDSNQTYIYNNTITETDELTDENDVNYLYAIDIYSCFDLVIDDNTIELISGGGITQPKGLGAAYCIQLTGPYTATISNNDLTSSNNGPNAGIYSQNYYGATNVTIVNNTIDVHGKASDNSWAVVTGMELQDTYATISGNEIYVTNIGDYGNNYNIYGISYCQATSGSHTYNITNNEVYVENSRYAIYIMNGINSNISGNTLASWNDDADYEGNDAIYIHGTNNTVGPNN